ncbi:MAG: hypothetical protein ACK42D_04000 [Candidatus Paceibacteria bacterium]
MTKLSNKPTHLEMHFKARSGYYLIQQTEGSLMQSARFPADKQILQLAEKAGLRDCSFHVFPRRPEARGFMFYVGSGSTPKQRETFLASLEAKSEFSLRTFSDDDLKQVANLLEQSPLFEVVIEGKRSFVTMHSVATAQNSLHVEVEVGDLVLELIGPKITVRQITREEINRINELSDDIEAQK